LEYRPVSSRQLLFQQKHPKLKKKGMPCNLCLSPLAEGVIRILECPDHWVHDSCFTPPLNPRAFRCQVCLRRGTSFVKAFMYSEVPLVEKEKVPTLEPAPATEEVKTEKMCIEEPAKEVEIKVEAESNPLVPPLDDIPNRQVSTPHPAVVSVNPKSSQDQINPKQQIIEHWELGEDDHYFSCHTCGNKYTTLYQAKRHIRKHDDQQRLLEQGPSPTPQPLSIQNLECITGGPNVSLLGQIKMENLEVQAEDESSGNEDW